MYSTVNTSTTFPITLLMVRSTISLLVPTTSLTAIASTDESTRFEEKKERRLLRTAKRVSLSHKLKMSFSSSFVSFWSKIGGLLFSCFSHTLTFITYFYVLSLWVVYYSKSFSFFLLT